MHSFEGRVAIVTGAGRGIGRAYALLLAERGAQVVVNDVDAEAAAEVVAEIEAAGGAAASDANDVSTVDGADALVATALARFGMLDALINNAGNIRWAAMPDVDADNLTQHLAVHLHGSFNTARAAWPRMAEEGYGRIVNTVSAGIFGLPANTSYAAAKGGVLGLTRSLAVAGRKAGIKVNAIAPAAATRMGMPPDQQTIDAMDPAFVAPMAAYLAHEDCPVTGETYVAGAGRFSRLIVATTEGVVHEGAPTIEDVAASWSTINDEGSYYVPSDLMAWSTEFMKHLPAQGS